MKKQDCYYWRLFATAFCFTSFGVGGILIGLLAVPFLMLVIFDVEQRQRQARRLNHRAFRFFIWQMKTLGVLNYDATGIKEHLNRPGQLIIANHPSLIDVVFLIAFIEQANCIVRQGLFHNIFTRGPVRNARYIPSGEAEALIEDCSERIKMGETLIIFPEGTRTPQDGRIPKCQRGAANIAIQAGVKPLPVRIKCVPATLSKGEKWYHIPLQRPHWTFELGEPLTLPEEASQPKAARALTLAMQNYFFKRIEP